MYLFYDSVFNQEHSSSTLNEKNLKWECHSKEDFIMNSDQFLEYLLLSLDRLVRWK